MNYLRILKIMRKSYKLFLLNAYVWEDYLSLRRVVKSIGIHSFGDTLKIELIEKEKSPGLSLDCPVWVYGSLNGKLDGKYIKTFTGVYLLVKDWVKD